MKKRETFNNNSKELKLISTIVKENNEHIKKHGVDKNHPFLIDQVVGYKNVYSADKTNENFSKDGHHIGDGSETITNVWVEINLLDSDDTTPKEEVESHLTSTYGMMLDHETIALKILDVLNDETKVIYSSLTIPYIADPYSYRSASRYPYVSDTENVHYVHNVYIERVKLDKKELFEQLLEEAKSDPEFVELLKSKVNRKEVYGEKTKKKSITK